MKNPLVSLAFDFPQAWLFDLSDFNWELGTRHWEPALGL
jgi:hypothetical protein